MEQYQLTFIDLALRRDALRFGRFTLKSGRETLRLRIANHEHPRRRLGRTRGLRHGQPQGTGNQQVASLQGHAH